MWCCDAGHRRGGRAAGALAATALLLGGPPAAAALRWDDPAAVACQRWIEPGSREFELLRELDRSGGLASTVGGGLPCTAAQADSLAAAAGDDPRARELRAWLQLAQAPRAEGPVQLGLRLQPLAEVHSFGANPPRQLRPLSQDVRNGSEVDPAWRLRAGLVADAALARRLVAHARFTFDSEGRNDPHNRTREFHQLGASNNLEEAYLRYAAPAWAVVLGRAFVAWGPERLGGLILSAEAPAADVLHGELHLGPHRLQMMVAQLSSETVADTVDVAGVGGTTVGTAAVPRRLGRFLYAHRLDLQLARRVRVGLTEAALVSDDGHGVQLKYINPIAFYAQVQVERDGNPSSGVNVVHGLDADVYAKGLHAYGSLMVDDLQVDAAPRKVWPDQLAWAAGVDLALAGAARAPVTVSYEYRRLGSWAYLHDGPGTDLQHFERPLGAPEGPDVDRHHLRASVWLRPAWQVWLAGERWRRGENRLSSDESRRGHAGEPFPRGAVERRWAAAGGVSRAWAPYGRLELAAGWTRIDPGLAGAPTEDILEVRAALTLRGPAWEALRAP